MDKKRGMASVYQKGHVLAPKVGTTDGDDEVAKKAAAFKTGEVANSTPLPTAKEADAANLPKGKGDTIAE
eukprot:gene18064-6251_t